MRLAAIISLLSVGAITQVLCQAPAYCKNVSATEREVYDKVFNNSFPWERPVNNTANIISVSVRLVMSGINDISEREGLLSLTGFVNLRWQDEIHIWNNTLPYACVASLHLGTNQAWIPEFALLNSANKYDLAYGDGLEKVKVFSNGTVSYRPGGTFQSFCKFDLTYFPFDYQQCSLEFESCRYPNDVQVFEFGEPRISTRYWQENEQWHFLGWSTNRSSQNYVSDAWYDHVSFSLVLRRKTNYYWVNIIMPSMIISFADLSVFTLPGEGKVEVSFMCLLAYGVFQLMIVDILPRSSDSIPLLAIYINISMAYIFLAIFGQGITFICLRLAWNAGCSSKQHRKVPPRLMAFARFIGYITCVSFDEKDELATADHQNHVVEEEVFAVSIHNGNPFSNPLGNHQALQMRLSVRSSGGRKDEAQGDNKDDSDPEKGGARKLARRLRYEWQFLANVAERFTWLFYLLLIVITPGIMFGVIPNYVISSPDFDFAPVY